MSLLEVIVASSVFLGACSGAAQIGAASAQAITQQRQQSQQLEQIEAQLLAVAPVMQAARAEAPQGLVGSDCGAVAAWMQDRLAADLPPAGAGLERQLSLSAAGDAVQLTLAVPGGPQRQRLFSPAAFGLCGNAAEEAGDAPL